MLAIPVMMHLLFGIKFCFLTGKQESFGTDPKSKVFEFLLSSVDAVSDCFDCSGCCPTDRFTEECDSSFFPEGVCDDVCDSETGLSDSVGVLPDSGPC